MLTDIQITLNPVLSVDVQAKLQYVKDHAGLQHLDYEHSGHTGFASSTYVNTELSKKVDKVVGSSLVPDTKVSSYDSHLTNHSNPHQVTKSQVGLGSVVNKGMDDSPTSGSANYVKSGGVHTELSKKVDKVSGSSLVPDSKVSSYDSHLTNKNNPHSVTKSQVGLGNCDNTSDANKPISNAVQNALNSKADLVNGVIPSSQLPSYVDDVVDFDKQVSGADFLAQTLATELGSMVWVAATKAIAGDLYYRKFLVNNDGTEAGLTIVSPESGKIYVGKTDTNCFRWTGSNLVEISKSIGLNSSRDAGTSTTAYQSRYGAQNYADIVELQNNKLPKVNPEVTSMGSNDNSVATKKYVDDKTVTPFTIFRHVIRINGKPDFTIYDEPPISCNTFNGTIVLYLKTSTPFTSISDLIDYTGRKPGEKPYDTPTFMSTFIPVQGAIYSGGITGPCGGILQYFYCSMYDKINFTYFYKSSSTTKAFEIKNGTVAKENIATFADTVYEVI